MLKHLHVNQIQKFVYVMKGRTFKICDCLTVDDVGKDGGDGSDAITGKFPPLCCTHPPPSLLNSRWFGVCSTPNKDD